MFALGRYAGARRRAIVAMKDRGRADLLAPLARSLALGIHRLLLWGLLDVPLTIVPAPSRGWSARHRGGDPVTRIATRATAGHPDITVVRALRMTAWARDSVGFEQRRPRTQHLRTSVADPPEYAGRAASCCWSTTSSPPAPPPVSRSACCTGPGSRVSAAAGPSGGVSVREELATGRAKWWQCRPWTVYRRDQAPQRLTAAHLIAAARRHRRR